jgi:hypothetical protein
MTTESSMTLVGIGGLTVAAMAATFYARGSIDRETLYLALVFIAMACGVLMSG